jgi:uncharacterized membrane protein
MQSSVPNQPPTDVEAGLSSAKHILTSFEFYLSLEILLFGLVVIVLEYLLLRKKNVRPEDTLRVYAVTLVIVGTLFAITAGYGSEQIAPAMGLFGTIAGYLLGRRSVTEKNGKDHNENGEGQ